MNEIYGAMDEKDVKIKTLSIANKDLQMINDKLIAEGIQKDKMIEELKLKIRNLKNNIKDIAIWGSVLWAITILFAYAAWF